MSCDHCGRDYAFVTGFVNDEVGGYAIYYAACHGHPEHEVQLDVALGRWQDSTWTDAFTFSCRYRTDGAMSVDAPLLVSTPSEYFGHRLTRDEALAHERIDDFWTVADLIIREDPDARVSLAGDPQVSSTTELPRRTEG
jgi:hypothetical protein